jgi:hypothetical protein
MEPRPRALSDRAVPENVFQKDRHAWMRPWDAALDRGGAA